MAKTAIAVLQKKSVNCMKYFNGSLEEVYQQLVQIPKMHGEFVLCIGPATNLKSALKQQFTDDDE